MSTPITPRDFPEIRWHGHWMWTETQEPGDLFSPGGGPRPEAHGLFRKTFTLGQVPARAPARMTADSRYVLYVNGRETFRGPVRSQPRRMYYDLFDIAPFLRQGENVCAVYVKYYGSVKSFWMPAVPNMMLGKSGVVVFEADLGEAGWLVSDPTWKAAKGDAWTELTAGERVTGGVPVEIFDARTFPCGWQEVGFDDRAWADAALIPAVHIGGFARTQPPTDPYGPLYPRDIAKLSGTRRTPQAIHHEILRGTLLPEAPEAVGPAQRVSASLSAETTHTVQHASLPLNLEVPAGGVLRLRLDMGVIVSGFVGFEVDAPSGTVLDLAYLEEPLTPDRGAFGVHAGTRYVARGRNDRFQVFDSNGLRYIYLLLHGVHGRVTVKDVWVQEQVYPWTGEAEFACDDEVLNRIFRAGIRTVQLNSHDAFVDCPTREQRAWVGDSVVHQMVHLATNGDWRLAWHYLALGNSPRPDGILPMSVGGDMEFNGGITIPDWALHWVHGVYNLYRFAGDADRVKAFLPTVERILRWYLPYQTSSGVLKDVVEWNLVDWASVSNEDTSAILSALWARGLREFGEMAGWLEERSSRRWAECIHEKIKAGFEAFWDEARGSYIDHIRDGVPRPEMSQLAGAVAILAGVAPEARWRRIVETITDPDRLVIRSWTGGGDGEYSLEKMKKQYQGIYEIDWDARREIVLAEPFMSYTVHDAVARAGREHTLPDLYLRWNSFLKDGYDTIGECWGWGTHVHGWSCSPTRDMIFYTLGVTPAVPGYARARIAPRLGRLAWAKGRVPTPHGFITVDVNASRVVVEAPVPVQLDLEGRPQQELPAGRHEVCR